MNRPLPLVDIQTVDDWLSHNCRDRKRFEIAVLEEDRTAFERVRAAADIVSRHAAAERVRRSAGESPTGTIVRQALEAAEHRLRAVFGDEPSSELDLIQAGLLALSQTCAPVRQVVKEALTSKAYHSCRVGPMEGPMRDEPAILLENARAAVDQAFDSIAAAASVRQQIEATFARVSVDVMRDGRIADRKVVGDALKRFGAAAIGELTDAVHVAADQIDAAVDADLKSIGDDVKDFAHSLAKRAADASSASRKDGD